MLKILFASLLACLAVPIFAQNAPSKNKVVISSEADLQKYENQLQTQSKTAKPSKTQNPARIPKAQSANTAEADYSEEELQKILEWYGQNAEENPNAFRSKKQANTTKNNKK